MTINNLKELCDILNISWEEFGNLECCIKPKRVPQFGITIIQIEVHTEEWVYALKKSQSSSYWHKIR